MQRSIPHPSRKQAAAHPSAPWWTTWVAAWQGSLHFDRSKVTAGAALRSAFGFGLPLVVGDATGHLLVGVALAAGASLAGGIGLTYTYRVRARTLLLACAANALAAFVGSLTGDNPWLSVLLAGLWGLGAGLLVAIDLPAMVIGLQACLTLIILSHFALPPAQAATEAALILAGALWQTLLALIPLPWRFAAPERAALAAVYRRLADYADHPTDSQSRAQLRDALVQAQQTIGDAPARGQGDRTLQELLAEAEAIRLNVLVLARLGPAGPSGVAAPVGARLVSAVAGALREIAVALPATPPLHARARHAITLPSLPAGNAASGSGELTIYYAALRAHVYAAQQLVRTSGTPHFAVRLPLPRQTYLRIHDVGTTLRANLTLHSSACRHALRLGAALALTTALYRLVPLPLGRGYWLPLTALLVLRPDFNATFTRGVARMLGTLVGVVLTTALVVVLAPAPALLVAANIVAAYCAFALLFANYALFTVFITVEVVFLLSFVTPQPLTLVGYRAVDTIIGGVLALALYRLWPTWERDQVPNALADRLDAVRRYADAVLAAHMQPGTYDGLAVQRLRMRARLARSNAVESVARAAQEPAPHQADADLAGGILAAADTIMQSLLALEARLLDDPARHALPDLRAFHRAVDDALCRLGAATRAQQPPPTLPDLAAALADLPATANALSDLPLVRAEADHIAHALTTIAQLLALHTPAPAANQTQPQGQGLGAPHAAS